MILKYNQLNSNKSSRLTRFWIFFTKLNVYASSLYLFFLVSSCSFIVTKAAIPIQFKISITSGGMKNSVYFNDPLENPWQLPLTESEKKTWNEAQEKKAAPTAAEKNAQPKGEGKPDTQDKFVNKPLDNPKYKDPITGEEFTQYAQNTFFGAGFMEAQVRHNDIVLGLSIGALYDNAKPIFTKSIEVPTVAKRIEIVEEAITTFKDNDSAKDRLSEEAKKLKSITKKSKAIKKDNNATIVQDSIQALPGWTVLAGAYIGYYLSDQFSIKAFVYGGGKNTQIEIITNEIKQEDKTVQEAKDKANAQSKKETGIIKRFTTKKQTISQEVQNISEDITLVKHVTEIGWMPGAMTGLMLSYNLNDSMEVWIMGAGMFFFDSLYQSAKNQAAKEDNKKEPAKDKDKEDASESDITDSQANKAFHAMNGPKYYLSIGMSIYLN